MRTQAGGVLSANEQEEKMGSPRQNRMRGAIAILFAALAVSRAILRGRGTPAFVAGTAGGILLVLGIYFLFRKD